MLHRLFAVLLLAGAVALPASAHAAACSGASGVTVVVQFPDHTEIGCADGDPSSGYQALTRAGFRLAMATGSGTGAICSINSYPDHACPSMPPSDAYWAYFHGKPGGSWSYSSTGGGGYNPKPGTVEGWRFGGGEAPSAPPPGSTSTPRPTPTASPTRQATSGPTARPTSGSASPSAKGSTSVQAPSGTPTAPDASASSSATGTPTAGPTATATDDATDAAQQSTASGPAGRSSEPADDNGGSSWLWGLVLIGVLAGSAGAVAVRRRKA